MTKTCIGHPQHTLAQDGAVGQHDRKGCIVADGANVAEMVGEAFKFGHQRTQPMGAGRYLHSESGLDRAGECHGIGNRAVAGHPAGELGGVRQIGSLHQRFNALVRVAQPCFQADDSFAIGVEAKMPWLDDAGVYRTDRDLMQAFTFGGQKRIRVRVRSCHLRAKRMAQAPAAMIKPGTQVRRVVGRQAEKVMNGAFQPDRRGVI